MVQAVGNKLTSSMDKINKEIEILNTKVAEICDKISNIDCNLDTIKCICLKSKPEKTVAK